MLTNSDLVALTDLRRDLHRHPEISGQEAETARRVTAAVADLKPSQILTGLGGHGVAAVFDSGINGPTLLFRAELDALPITEHSDALWVSQNDGTGHLCGHDGHMTMLLAFGHLLARRPVAKGRIVLMFQPAEEDGSGARAVVADPAYQGIQPDWAFAIHNDPGRPFGQVATRAGLINCASVGLQIRLSGKTAHAAEPEAGLSPALAMAELIPALSSMAIGGALDENFQLVTLTHACLGEPTFGIAPGEAVIHVTLRSAADAALEDLQTRARALALATAQSAGLRVEFELFDHFAASINHPEAAEVAIRAMDRIGVTQDSSGLPLRASEDFGVFGWAAKSAMLCLGPGVDFPALHNPDYDFPDDLIPIGAAIFDAIARDLLSDDTVTDPAFETGHDGPASPRP